MGPTPAPFWSRVEVTGHRGSCWLWKGAITSLGYGNLKRNGKSIVAHRYAYEFAVGPIPVGMEVCHHCDVRNCVNPDHLFLGTHQENVRDAENKGRMKHPDNSGANYGAAKFAWSDIYAIRYSGLPTKYFAAIFESPENHIRDIKNYRYWKET